MFGLSPMVVQLLLGAVEEAPAFFDEAKGVFEELASKDDGLVKLTKAAAAFAALAGHAANSAHVAAGGTQRNGSVAFSSARIVNKVDPAGEVASGGIATDPQGRPLDATGQPILNAADQAALQQQK